MPEIVRKYYVEFGKRCRPRGIALTEGKSKGKVVIKSMTSQARKKGKYFYDWYDLEGVIDTPIHVARSAQQWIGLILAKFKCALDDRICFNTYIGHFI